MRIVVHATAAAVAIGLVSLAATSVDIPSKKVARAQPDVVVASALPRPRLRNPLPDSLRIVGEVAGHGSASSAILTVTMGGKVVLSQAITLPSYDYVPAYSVDLPAGRDGDVVTLAVDAGNIRFTSLVGTYGAMVARAGADRVLEVTEWDALRLDPLSTAFEFFVTRAGGPPQSDTHIEASARRVSGEDIGTAMLVLSRLAKGVPELPEGYANGYELLADEAAYASLLSQSYISTEAVANEIQSLPFTAFTTSEALETVALLDGMTDPQTPMMPPLAQVMEPSGSGMHYLHGEEERPSFASELHASGALELVPTEAVSYETYTVICPATGRRTLETHTLLGERQYIMRRGVHMDLRGSRLLYKVTNDCPTYATVTRSVSSIRHAVDLRHAHPWGLVRRVKGTRTLPGFCKSDDHLTRCDHAPHTFHLDGQGLATDLGPKIDDAMLPVQGFGDDVFTWRMGSPQVLHVTKGGVDARYWLLDAGDRVASGLVYVAKADVGGATRSVAGYSASISVNTFEGYEAIPPTGSWKFALSEQQPVRYGAMPVQPFRITRTAEGLSDGWWAARWHLNWGRLYESNVKSDYPTPWFHRDCDEARALGATMCAPLAVRYFHPLVKRGNRLYGIEAIHYNRSVDFEPPHEYEYDVRPIYQELVEE